MKAFDNANERIRNLDILDLGLTKLGVASVVLMLVTFWPRLASLQWYWYLIIAAVLSIRPLRRFFGK